MRVLGLDVLKKLLCYEPDNGKLFWKERDISFFQSGKQSAQHNCRIWNAKFAGREAFTAISKGYRVGALLGQNYLAHRVIWALCFGTFPDNQIDHINGDRSDNRLENLRSVSNRENCKNQGSRSDNSTGVTGVYWFKRDSRWVASICADGTQIHLGYFDKFDDAVSARKAAERKYGFHPNHGRTAA